TYNAAGDMAELMGPTGCITGYEYVDHRLSGITDPEGFATTYTYDFAGRVLTRSVAGNLGRYTYAVDANRVVTMTYEDPLQRVWTYTADPGGNPMWEIDP